MKTYQLLRNNKQMGLYTKTCLLQIGLEPMDLLWIDGESITWKYPSELEEFRAYVTEAECNEATVVNSRKEMQIRYFDSHVAQMEYKKINIEYIQEPDALLNDINPGFEYLILAQDYKLSDLAPESEIAAEMEAGQEAVEAVREIINHSYSIMGTRQTIDTPELQADVYHQSIFWTTSHTQKKQMRAMRKGRKRNFLKINFSAAVMGIIGLASAVLNIKM